MSASHTPSPGQTPVGNLPSFMRRRQQAANPLVKPKRQLPKPRPQDSSATKGTKVNGTTGAKGPQTPLLGKPNTPSTESVVTEASEEYVDYPIFASKREMLEGFRYHVMRFQPNASATVKNVDPADEAQFLRPVKLHRRDPKASTTMHWREAGSGEGGEDSKGNVMDDKEREKLEIQRSERRAEREANQAQMAPVAKSTNAVKKNHFQKKTEQVFQVSDNAGKRKAAQLRYEEALPWHVEDFDSKNIWAGSYEAALSDCHIMLIPEGPGSITHFRMVPVEKWYKFTAKNLFKALSIDEAEARMSKKVKDPRWFMETQSAEARQRKEELLRKGGAKLFTRTGERGERKIKAEGEEERGDVAADADDIDYNYEEAFADDEENPLFGGDEDEVKEAEEKIKREQREANIFELKEEKDYDKEEEEEKLRAELEKKLSKRTQKALMKREKNYVYEDDSEGNPYSSESASEDSEAERLKEEERKKAEEQQQTKVKTDATEKPPSAPSSVKGTSTPTKGTKQPEVLRKGILKRPGSPNLSEASGSESSRKKLKKKHAPEAGSTVGPGPAARATNANVNRVGAGSGSDGEVSDAGRRTLKMRLTGAASRTVSPNGSRAASPAPPRPGTIRLTLSPRSPRANRAVLATEANSALVPDMPTNEEVRSKIPAEGILLSDLMRKFAPGLIKRQEFSTVLKANSRYDKDTKKLYPKT